MKHFLLTFLSVTLFSAYNFSIASGDLEAIHDKNEVRYITNNKRLPDAQYQQELRNKPNWQNFVQHNGKWFVIFNEENARPHRAFGKPIPVFGSDIKSRALNFIGTKLQGFNIPVSNLVYAGDIKSANYHYANFTQLHNGLQVLNSRLTVKMTPDGKVVLFGADVFTDIDVSAIQPVSEDVALANAKAGLDGTITNYVVMNELRILPMPEYKRNVYKLVYEFMIETMSASGVPAKYKTLVDAATGTVISRINQVRHFHPEPGGSGTNVTGTLYTTNSYDPSSVNPLVNMKVVQNGNTFYTDASGNVGGLTPGSATFSLSGLWSTVFTNGVTPILTATLVNGTNDISFDNTSTIQERSAYYHVNIIHDYMKTKFPFFTDMDNALTTNIDLNNDNCNAFYNGSSINFYAQNNGCTSFATIGDVVYHEYGHGINHTYYMSVSGSFDNGAMDEGYADTWAIGVTANPVLGIGSSTTSSADFIRRYDQAPKVYPQDITGEVHNDGEIIAGAWWDLSVNLGNHQQMMDLFAQTFNGAVTGPDGTEGQVYVDILIEALTNDDVPSNGGDNDITTGTPNDIDIVSAFNRHGITLLSNATLDHTPIEANNGSTGIDIDATVTLQYPWALEGALLFYTINRSGTWSSLPLNNTSGNNYSAQIPGQPLGTLIAYYLALENINGVLSAVQPVAAEVDPYPNTPYFILNGFALEHTEDFDNTQGQWTEGIPSDNNTTGDWIIDVPTGSFSDGIPVQPGDQTTPGGIVCAITGNATSTSSALGDNDVDGGKTTLVSPVFDLSGYTNPLFTFMKWYTNNPPSGANPRADWWQVQVSGDGNTWQYVENTLAGERNWRRFAFRVADYVDLSGTVQVRFIASDSTHSGQNLDGGSLIEAAIDDLKLYEEGIDDSPVEENNISRMAVFPVPAKEYFTVSFEINESENLSIELFCSSGQLVKTISRGKISPGFQKFTVDVADLPPGVYFMSLRSGSTSIQRKITVIR